MKCDCQQTGKLRTVSTPSGSCPIHLRSTDEAAVREWVERVIQNGVRAGICYEPKALRYWAAQMFDRNSEEYQVVCNHITKLVGSEKVLNTISAAESIINSRRDLPRPRIDPDEMYQDLRLQFSGSAETGRALIPTPEPVSIPMVREEKPRPKKPQTIGVLAPHLLKGR